MNDKLYINFNYSDVRKIYVIWLLKQVVIYCSYQFNYFDNLFFGGVVNDEHQNQSKPCLVNF